MLVELFVKEVVVVNLNFISIIVYFHINKNKLKKFQSYKIIIK